MRTWSALTIGAAALALGACEPTAPAEPQPAAEPVEAPRQDREPVSPTPPVVKARVTPAGPPVTVEAADDEGARRAAEVTQVHPLETQDARLFSTAGGDPAINGLITWLGLFQGPAEGWRVFRIGDFESWRVIDEAEGRVVLEVAESSLNPDTGLAMTRRKRVIVRFNPDSPQNITVTPAS